MSCKIKRAHQTRAKTEALESYGYLNAFGTMERRDSSKIGQIYPKSNCFYKIHFDKKNLDFYFFKLFENLEF